MIDGKGHGCGYGQAKEYTTLYGIGYMGSKSRLVKKFAYIFPKADHFYDLFGGGFSVTHCMIEKRATDYKHFHFNEIRPGACDFIKRAIAGEFSYDIFKPPWVSREKFFEKVETDAYIKLCWSFGNDGHSYLFGKDIEKYKRSMHQCVVFNEFDEIAKTVTGLVEWPAGVSTKNRRLFIRNRVEYFRKTIIPEILVQFLNKKQRALFNNARPLSELQRLHRLQQLQQLLHLERLQRLQRLERLQQLQRLAFYNSDYKSVPIKSNAVIYCDIPYSGTSEYDKNKTFNHKDFFDWAANQSEPVYISEYNIQDERFTLLKEIKTKSTKSSIKTTDAVERIYGNAAATCGPRPQHETGRT